MPENKKVILLGMAAAMTYADVEKLRREVNADFPDHIVRVIPGLMFATELETSVAEITERPAGAYL